MHIARVSSYSNAASPRGIFDVIDERDGGTLFGFTDPDGNSPPQAGGAPGVVQQIKARAN